MGAYMQKPEVLLYEYFRRASSKKSCFPGDSGVTKWVLFCQPSCGEEIRVFVMHA